MYSKRLRNKCGGCTNLGTKCDQTIFCDTIMAELLEDLRYPDDSGPCAVILSREQRG